jgi:hypothetical protein
MNARRLCSLLSLPLLFAACQRDGDEDVTISEEAYETPAAVAEITPEGQTTGPTVTLEPRNASEVMGDLVMAPGETSTQLSGMLYGFEAGDSVRGHIHRGTCEALRPGAEGVAHFGPIMMTEPGKLDATIPLTVNELNQGEYALAFHRGSDPSHVSCGDVGQSVR